MRVARCPKENRQETQASLEKDKNNNRRTKIANQQAADEIGKISNKFPLGRCWTLQLRKDNKNKHVKTENLLLSMKSSNLLA